MNCATLTGRVVSTSPLVAASLLRPLIPKVFLIHKWSQEHVLVADESVTHGCKEMRHSIIGNCISAPSLCASIETANHPRPSKGTDLYQIYRV